MLYNHPMATREIKQELVQSVNYKYWNRILSPSLNKMSFLYKAFCTSLYKMSFLYNLFGFAKIYNFSNT